LRNVRAPLTAALLPLAHHARTDISRLREEHLQMANNTMGNNPNRDSSGKSNERREGMGKEQDQRQASRSDDQSTRKSPGQGNQSNQSNQSDRGSQVGKTSPSRDQH
jgi:hypothetical protein